MTPEQQGRIQELRAKSLSGTLTLEETREAIQIMREDRVRASATSAKARAPKAAKAPAKSGDDLLSELDGL